MTQGGPTGRRLAGGSSSTKKYSRSKSRCMHLIESHLFVLDDNNVSAEVGDDATNTLPFVLRLMSPVAYVSGRPNAVDASSPSRGIVSGPAVSRLFQRVRMPGIDR